MQKNQILRKVLGANDYGAWRSDAASRMTQKSKLLLLALLSGEQILVSVELTNSEAKIDFRDSERI